MRVGRLIRWVPGWCRQSVLFFTVTWFRETLKLNDRDGQFRKCVGETISKLINEGYSDFPAKFAGGSYGTHLTTRFEDAGEWDVYLRLRHLESALERVEEDHSLGAEPDPIDAMKHFHWLQFFGEKEKGGFAQLSKLEMDDDNWSRFAIRLNIQRSEEASGRKFEPSNRQKKNGKFRLPKKGSKKKKPDKLLSKLPWEAPVLTNKHTGVDVLSKLENAIFGVAQSKPEEAAKFFELYLGTLEAVERIDPEVAKTQRIEQIEAIAAKVESVFELLDPHSLDLDYFDEDDESLSKAAHLRRRLMKVDAHLKLRLAENAVQKDQAYRDSVTAGHDALEAVEDVDIAFEISLTRVSRRVLELARLAQGSASAALQEAAEGLRQRVMGMKGTEGRDALEKVEEILEKIQDLESFEVPKKMLSELESTWLVVLKQRMSLTSYKERIIEAARRIIHFIPIDSGEFIEDFTKVESSEGRLEMRKLERTLHSWKAASRAADKGSRRKLSDSLSLQYASSASFLLAEVVAMNPFEYYAKVPHRKQRFDRCFSEVIFMYKEHELNFGELIDPMIEGGKLGQAINLANSPDFLISILSPRTAAPAVRVTNRELNVLDRFGDKKRDFVGRLMVEAFLAGAVGDYHLLELWRKFNFPTEVARVAEERDHLRKEGVREDNTRLQRLQQIVDLAIEAGWWTEELIFMFVNALRASRQLGNTEADEEILRSLRDELVEKLLEQQWDDGDITELSQELERQSKRRLWQLLSTVKGPSRGGISVEDSAVRRSQSERNSGGLHNAAAGDSQKRGSIVSSNDNARRSELDGPTSAATTLQRSRSSMGLQPKSRWLMNNRMGFTRGGSRSTFFKVKKKSTSKA